jgi:DNA polymerase II small subunit
MVNKILKLCIDKGFLLDKSVLKILNDLDEDKACEIINILSGLNLKERLISEDLFNSHIDKFREFLINDVKIDSCESNNISVLSEPFGFSKADVGSFVDHFRNRYECMKGIIEKRGFDNLISIRRIGSNSGVYTIIAMVSGKKITKNKNLLLEVEDLTGSSVVLVNKENVELFERMSELMLDDVVGFCVSGSSDMLFASDVVFPDSELKSEKFGEVDEYIAFTGDFHVGSKMFLENNFLKFVSWLNGEVGDERYRSIARKVKYLVLTGDNIDGIGVYQGQENFLNIKTCRGQYRKLADILGKIRSDVQIIMCAGQHDAVWVGEPQGIVSEKWAPDLHRMKNLQFVSNPSLVDISGFKVLMYHGAGINRFIDDIPRIRSNYGHIFPTKVVLEMLKRRHLSPTHGLVDYVPCVDFDLMVIKEVPDIVVTGDQHRAEVGCYNNILMVSSSCWQSITSFEEKMGEVPDPCKVPLFNLKSREVKIIDFSGDDAVKWDEGDHLSCKLEGCCNG